MQDPGAITGTTAATFMHQVFISSMGQLSQVRIWNQPFETNPKANLFSSSRGCYWMRRGFLHWSSILHEEWQIFRYVKRNTGSRMTSAHLLTFGTTFTMQNSCLKIWRATFTPRSVCTVTGRVSWRISDKTPSSSTLTRTSRNPSPSTWINNLNLRSLVVIFQVLIGHLETMSIYWNVGGFTPWFAGCANHINTFDCLYRRILGLYAGKSMHDVIITVIHVSWRKHLDLKGWLL